MTTELTTDPTMGMALDKRTRAKKAGQQRSTRQRAVIIDALHASDQFQSAQALHASLLEAGEHIGLATVYRALQALSEIGQVDVIQGLDGEAVYKACQERHHHHLVCRLCGTAVEIASEPIEEWARRVAADHGFTEVSHTVEVFGLCPDCSRR